MNTILILAKMECERYAAFMLGSQKRNYKWISAFLLLMLIACIYLMKDYTTINALFASSIFFLFETMLVLVLFETMTYNTKQDREWWLLLPYSRMSLLLGKALGYIRMSAHLVLYAAIVLTIHSLIYIHLGKVQQAGSLEIIQIIGANLLFILVGLPVIIAIGLFMTAFQTWWARIVGVLIIFYLNIPMLVFWLISRESEWALSNLSPSRMVWYALITAAIGWPLSALSIWASSTIGMKQLGNVGFRGRITSAFISPAKVSNNNREPHRLQQKHAAKQRSPFWALFTLEIQRYLWLGRRSPLAVRVIGYVLMVIVVILTYRSAVNLRELVSFQSLLMMLPYMAINIYYINKQTEFQKGLCQWWITLPHSRFILAGSRAAAYLTAMLSYILILLLCAVVGVALRQWIDPIPFPDVIVAGQFLGCYMLLYFPLIGLSIMAFQIAPALLKHPIFFILAVPLYSGYVWGFQLANKIIMPGREERFNIQHGPASNFGTHLLLLYSIAIPFAALCFWLGAKYMNSYSLAKQPGWGRKEK